MRSRRFLLLMLLVIFRGLVLVGLALGLAASDAAWPVVIVAFASAWAVITAASRLAQRNGLKGQFSPPPTRHAKRLQALGDAFGAAGMAMLVLVGTDGLWPLVTLIVIFVGAACWWASSRIDQP